MRVFIIGAGASVASGIPTSKVLRVNLPLPDYSLLRKPLFLGFPDDLNEIIRITNLAKNSIYEGISNFEYPEDIVDYMYKEIISNKYKPDYGRGEDILLDKYLSLYYRAIWNKETCAINTRCYGEYELLNDIIELEDTIITFNYDSLFERRLMEKGKFNDDGYYDVCKIRKPGSCKVYKPHKGFNMLTCDRCNQLLLDWSL